MPDPRSTVELALACRGAAWFPGDLHDVDRREIEYHIERIAWVEAVWLVGRGWSLDPMPDDGSLLWNSDPHTIHDPGPLRAMLLAAIAAEEQSRE